MSAVLCDLGCFIAADRASCSAISALADSICALSSSSLALSAAPALAGAEPFSALDLAPPGATPAASHSAA